MLAAIADRAATARARLEALTAPVAERLSPAYEVVAGWYSVLLPYATKVFHYGFIPLVLVLGMSSPPQPKLIDLLMPM